MDNMNFLCFTAGEPGSTVKLAASGRAPSVDLQTSTDGVTWDLYNIGDTITLDNEGDKVYFKAVGSNWFMANSPFNFNQFEMTGAIAASGNVNSLLEEDEDTAMTMSLDRGYCYYGLFYNCTSLTQAPELPATTLGSYCYRNMFRRCQSLTQAPALPATTLADNCYYGMFAECTLLTTPPELPATTLENSCYCEMFSNCDFLTQAPELPATTLASSCYDSMFSGCTALTQAPALPATTLASGCYVQMFYGCASLTQAPELPATTLVSNCYTNMFLYCPSLNYVKVGFTSWDPPNATSNWLPNNAGTFECDKELIKNTTERTTSTIPPDWTVPPLGSKKFISFSINGRSVSRLFIDGREVKLGSAEEPGPLCFTAKQAGSTVSLNTQGTFSGVSLQTSTDGTNWINYTIGNTINLANVGDKVYFKTIGVNDTFSINATKYYKFVMQGMIAASGNVNSLLNENFEDVNTLPKYCFYGLFRYCEVLDQAPELPATSLGTNCYQNMFQGCTALTRAPELPATTLADSCYSGMFRNCSSLTQAPALPATTLASYCYSSMFQDCTSLAQAPELPATTLADGCYSTMFWRCTSLNNIKVRFTNWDPSNATETWLPSNSGTFECPWELITNTSTRSADTVPSSWTMVAA